MELLCPFAVIAIVVAAFASHRHWKGKLSLTDKYTSGSGSAFALQEIVEPNVQHVILAKEKKPHSAENGSPPDEDESEKPHIMPKVNEIEA